MPRVHSRAAGGALRRILIAEAHCLVREALRALLSSMPGLEVVGAVASGAEAAGSVAAADVVVLGVSLGEDDGLTALREIKRTSPRTRTLVLTARDGEEDLWAALQAGADGYLLENASREELVLALDSVLHGGRFVSPRLSGHIVSRYLQRSPYGDGHSRLDALTLRERQVLKLVAAGCRNRDIAGRLSISVKMVEKHRASLMDKLHLHSTAALTRLAIEKGLLGRPA
jgi:DNA-binding NarL/FixJ family response regulator